MNSARKDRFLAIVRDLIAEGEAVAATRFTTDVIGAPTFVKSQELHRWFGKVQSFASQLGRAARPWQDVLTTNPDRNTQTFTLRVLGTLEAIEHEIKNDHLETITDLVRAETLADLLEQAEVLFESGYYLAAGVIGRAVLDEHLRTTCQVLGCISDKARPTINDFNQSLYSADHYNKIRLKQIEALAAVGNSAAHNSAEITREDIRRFLQDLPEVIEATGV